MHPIEKEIQKLTKDEQLELLSWLMEKFGSSETVNIPDWHKNELDYRLQKKSSNDIEYSSLHEVKAKFGLK